MIAANAGLVLQTVLLLPPGGLNRATSTINLMCSGAKGLVSLVGGIPGLVMLEQAWYTVYQKQEQARKSALEYGQAIAMAKPVSGLVVHNNSNEIDKPLYQCV
jgi:hypothetical protein